MVELPPTKPLFYYARRWRNNGQHPVRRQLRLKMLMRRPLENYLDRLETLLSKNSKSTGFGKHFQSTLAQLILSTAKTMNYIADVPLPRKKSRIRWALRHAGLTPFHGKFVAVKDRHLLAVKNKEIGYA